LTAFGKQAVAEMNRVGIIVDLAHATYMTSKDAVAASSQPVMLSHSFLADEATQNFLLALLQTGSFQHINNRL